MGHCGSSVAAKDQVSKRREYQSRDWRGAVSKDLDLVRSEGLRLRSMSRYPLDDVVETEGRGEIPSSAKQAQVTVEELGLKGLRQMSEGRRMKCRSSPSLLATFRQLFVLLMALMVKAAAAIVAEADGRF